MDKKTRKYVLFLFGMEIAVYMNWETKPEGDWLRLVWLFYLVHKSSL